MHAFESSVLRLQVLWILLMAGLASGCGEAEPAQKVYTIGVASGFDPFDDIYEGFQEGMAELGYSKGIHVAYDFQRVTAGQETDRQVIADFINRQVDLILTYPTEASLWTKELTRDTQIPVVFALAGIEGNDLIDDVHRPGGNLTGIRYSGPDLIIKRLELLREIAPNARRVWTAYDIHYPTNTATIDMLRAAASASGVTLLEARVTSPDEIRTDLESRVVRGRAGFDAILIMADAVSQDEEGWSIISAFAETYRIPIVGTGGAPFGAHTVIGYNPDFFEVGKQAASLADQIFQGVPAGSLMVPTAQAHLQVNYKLARELSLKVPEGLLSRADTIIR